MRRNLDVLVIAGTVVLLLSCNSLRPATPSREASPDSPTEAFPSPDPGFSFVDLQSSGDLGELLATHAGHAAELGRRPFALFSADWCPSCVALEESLSDERMREAFSGTYIVRVDIDEWGSRLGSPGFRVVGVPTFFELGQDGSPTGRVLTGAAWGADTVENMAPCLTEFLHGD